MQKPIRILIVDDQPRARRSMRALLSTWTRAPGFREEVRLVEELPPDLVLMDVRMPEMDGLEATGQIKARWPQVKVIVLSMYIERRDEALAAGADGFVGKAEAPDSLPSVLSDLVEKG